MTFDLLSGVLYPGDPSATENSRSYLGRGLTARLAQLGINRDGATAGRVTVRGGRQILWQRS